MIYWNKYFKIPGPADLGMSDHNHGMAMAGLRNYVGEPTWEDYYARVKKEYPVRYFFASQLPEFVRKLWRKISRRPKDAWYWLQCHFHPNHRYHLVNLNQSENGEEYPYRYGWIDTDWRITYAMMNLLVEFVEKEMVHGYFVPSEEEVALDDGTDNRYMGFKRQLDNHKEYMEIYNYWKKGRHEDEAALEVVRKAWHDARFSAEDGSHDTPEIRALFQAMRDAEEANDKKLDSMLHRLVDIRHCLWT